MKGAKPINRRFWPTILFGRANQAKQLKQRPILRDSDPRNAQTTHTTRKRPLHTICLCRTKSDEQGPHTHAGRQTGASRPLDRTLLFWADVQCQQLQTLPPRATTAGHLRTKQRSWAVRLQTHSSLRPLLYFRMAI